MLNMYIIDIFILLTLKLKNLIVLFNFFLLKKFYFKILCVKDLKFNLSFMNLLIKVKYFLYFN